MSFSQSPKFQSLEKHYQGNNLIKQLFLYQKKEELNDLEINDALTFLTAKSMNLPALRERIKSGYFRNFHILEENFPILISSLDPTDLETLIDETIRGISLCFPITLQQLTRNLPRETLNQHFALIAKTLGKEKTVILYQEAGFSYKECLGLMDKREVAEFIFKNSESKKSVDEKLRDFKRYADNPKVLSALKRYVQQGHLKNSNISTSDLKFILSAFATSFTEVDLKHILDILDSNRLPNHLNFVFELLNEHQKPILIKYIVNNNLHKTPYAENFIEEIQRGVEKYIYSKTSDQQKNLLQTLYCFKKEFEQKYEIPFDEARVKYDILERNAKPDNIRLQLSEIEQNQQHQSTQEFEERKRKLLSAIRLYVRRFSPEEFHVFWENLRNTQSHQDLDNLLAKESRFLGTLSTYGDLISTTVNKDHEITSKIKSNRK